MRTVQVTASLSTAGGGVSLAVLALAGALERDRPGGMVAGMEDDGGPLPLPDGLRTQTYPASAGFPLRRSEKLRRALTQSGADLFQVHGLWTYPSMIVPGIARAKKVPWLVSPHGMLDAWALANSRWKKRLAAWGFENQHLRGAACLHALCAPEAQSIRAYGLKNPVVVIPNGVDLPELGGLGPRDAGGVKTLLFLGRIHPKKGLIPLLKAWAALRPADWRLVIAGWGQGGHEEELQQLCRELGLGFAKIPADGLVSGETNGLSGAGVVFAGAAFGAAKDALLRLAHAFVLPSFSEGLPMAVLEAWAYGLPVLMTPGCNLPEGFTAGAAIPCSTEPGVLRTELQSLLTLSPQALHDMGARGRDLVAASFTWSAVARRMGEVHLWLAGGGARPGLVD